MLRTTIHLRLTLTAVSSSRRAKEGKLVEICNHGWWGQPALGALGPPAESLQGSLGPHPGRQARVGCCHWCKAGDHLVKDCPLNEYFGEQPSKSVQQELQQPANQKGRGTLVMICCAD